MPIPTLPGITASTITTPRLTTRVLFSGADDGIPVLFLHGNASSATYWEETMLALPAGYRGIAPDQRGYGDADRAAKSTRRAACATSPTTRLRCSTRSASSRAHLAGHSLGGSVIWQLLIDHPERFLTVTLAAPGSPFGFGGTKDVDGTPHWPDFAGSGGGVVNPTFTQLMAAGDRGSDNPQASPRIVMNSFYWKPPFKPAREEDLLSSLLSEHIGEQEYPGDMVPSPTGRAPRRVSGGQPTRSRPNTSAISARSTPSTPSRVFCGYAATRIRSSAITRCSIWARSASLGAVPGWPGMEIYPPQPMVSQTRAVLEKYKAAGGQYSELVFTDVGHTPYIEKPDEFNQAFHAQLGA